jgi:glycosyltransferase involved in cell wall biosynthesis
LWKLLREHSAAILHLHTLERRLLSLVRTMRDARVVLHHHGHLSAEISDARWNRILSLRGAIQVCDAQWMARTLRERVKLDAPIFAVPVAVELDRFASASAERGERLRAELGGAPLVGWVGRLSREKGCDLFLESARIIQGKIPAAKFCVVGDGALRGKLEQLAGRLGIASAVSFLGMRDDVPDLLAAMDVLVLSSREEGLPFIVIEAMAARRPVAAFDLEGVREIVGVEAGVLTPPENAEALASAVVELLGAPDRRARLAEAGQRRARELFDIEKVTRQMEAIYDGVLSAKSNA